MQTKAAQIILHEPEKVWFKPRGLFRLLGIKKVPVWIYPLHLGTIIKISKLLAKLKPIDGNNLASKPIQEMFSNIEVNGWKMCKMIAYGIINNWLFFPLLSYPLALFIYVRLSNNEILGLLSIIIEQTQTKSFQISIVSLKGLDILNPKTEKETSPSGTEEIIAPGDSSGIQ